MPEFVCPDVRRSHSRAWIGSMVMFRSLPVPPVRTRFYSQDTAKLQRMQWNKEARVRHRFEIDPKQPCQPLDAAYYHLRFAE